MIRTILVPLDGSPLSERALLMAAVIARAIDARLVLMRAAWATTIPGADASVPQLCAVTEAEDYLAGVASRLAELDLRPEIAVPYATAADGILLEAELHHADLIIMCTHGRSGLGRWIYGSVAEAVLARSPVPVLLTRPTGRSNGLVREWGRSRLLVPLDGSPFSEAALPEATALAHALDSTVILLRVVASPPPHAPDLLLAQPVTSEEAIKEEQACAERYLTGIADQLVREGVRARTVVRIGLAADAILEQSQSSGAGLVVMATHGRTGLGRLLFGSVAAEVLQRGVLPLLLVRPPALRQKQTIQAHSQEARVA